MFKSTASRDRAAASAPSILGLDLKVTGDISTAGEVHISGMVKGDVIAKQITIGETGTVIGSIEAETAMVAGTLTGRLSASKVVLASTSRVVADITHVSLSIEPGAVFEGYSRRVDAMDQAEGSLPLVLPSARGTITPIAGGKVAHGE